MVMDCAIPENETKAGGVIASPVETLSPAPEGACGCGGSCACLGAACDDDEADDHEEPCTCGSARRCLVSGDVCVKAAMIRFVASPTGSIVPDVAEKLPGRGLWVRADRKILDEAVRKNPFTRAMRQACTVPSDLVPSLESLLTRRVLDLLGLAKAAGIVVLGQPQVEEALKKKALAAILLASDAGGDVRKKLARAALIETPFPRDELGAALGREALVSIGLRDHPLVEALGTSLARLFGVMGDEASCVSVLKTTNGDCEKP